MFEKMSARFTVQACLKLQALKMKNLNFLYILSHHLANPSWVFPPYITLYAALYIVGHLVRKSDNHE